jgi:hypothetical protein
VRLDDNEISISGTRRADVTGVSAWEPSCRGFGIAKILEKLQLHPRQGCQYTKETFMTNEFLDPNKQVRLLKTGKTTAVIESPTEPKLAPPVRLWKGRRAGR